MYFYYVHVTLREYLSLTQRLGSNSLVLWDLQWIAGRFEGIRVGWQRLDVRTMMFVGLVLQLEFNLDGTG
jgi:hypothetical protein